MIGMLINRTSKKVHLILLLPQFSNWIVSKAIGLNSFDKILIDMLLAKFGFCVKIICCLFGQFFIGYIDEKYRSAFAHLVNIFELNITMINKFPNINCCELFGRISQTSTKLFLAHVKKPLPRQAELSIASSIRCYVSTHW